LHLHRWAALGILTPTSANQERTLTGNAWNTVSNGNGCLPRQWLGGGANLLNRQLTVTSVEPGGQQGLNQLLNLLVKDWSCSSRKSMWPDGLQSESDDGRAHIRARLALIPVVCGISVLSE